MKKNLIQITKEKSKDYIHICSSYGEDNVNDAYHLLNKWMGMTGKYKFWDSVKYYVKENSPKQILIKFYTDKECYKNIIKNSEKTNEN
jgi:hypothetical protein